MHPALLHLSDSALPVGAYAHSMGLEGMCQDGAVVDEKSFRTFLLRDVRHALAKVDLPLIARAHAAVDDPLEIARLDTLSLALRPTRALREAATKIGRAQWRIYQDTWGRGHALPPAHCPPPTSSAVVLGVIHARLDTALDATLWSGAYATYSGLVQAALKLLPLGPAATQRLLTESLQAITADIESAPHLPESEFGTFTPAWDIASARHENAAARLFLS